MDITYFMTMSSFFNFSLSFDERSIILSIACDGWHFKVYHQGSFMNHTAKGFIVLLLMLPIIGWNGYVEKTIPFDAPPRGVYTLPEFKLAIKKEDDSYTTIVQVKLGIAYEKDNQEVLNELITRKVQLLDTVQFILAKKTYEEIITYDKREEGLKKDLLKALRQIIEGEIFDIYFDKFVIARIQS